MRENESLSEYAAGEIRAEIARSRTSGREVAAKLGVSRSWLSYRLTGTTEITLNDLARIADALDVPISALLPTADTRESRGFRSTSILPAGYPTTPRPSTAPGMGRGTPKLKHPPVSTRLPDRETNVGTPSTVRRPVRLSTPTQDGQA
jgi:transcriptional regulator with XRE-family HTH domain